MVTGKEKSNSVVDTTFSIEDCTLYQLLLHFDGETINYAVVDPGTNVVVVIGHETNDLSIHSNDFLTNILKNNEILKQEYKNAALSISGLPDTLIPSTLFKKDKAEILFQFTSKEESNDIKEFQLPKLKATLIHATDKTINSIFLAKHPYGKLYFNSGLLIESILRTHRFDKGEKIIIDIRQNSFDLFAIRKGKLLIYNQFKTETDNDLLYHLMNTAQQLEIDIQKALVLVSGKITKNDSIHNLLLQYVKHLEFNNGLDDTEVALSLNKVPLFKYMSLLNLSVCV